MGIPQVDTFNKIGLYVPKSHSKKFETEPPAIPPRMKAKGPELPEKPAHLRLASLTTKTSNHIPSHLSGPRQTSSHQQQNHQTNPLENNNSRNKSTENHLVSHGWNQSSNNQKLFLDAMRKKSGCASKEVLVAATKGSRDRPAEKRQREPAKLLMPISQSSEKEDTNEHHDSLPVLLGLSSPKPRRKTNPPPSSNVIVSKKDSYKPVNLGSNSQKIGKSRAPVILIPRSQLDTRNLHQIWNSYPISYSVWVQNSGSGEPQMTSRLFRRSLSPNSLVIKHPNPDKYSKNSIVKSTDFPVETKIFNLKKSPLTSTTSVKPRSSSVTRSGSLTSHGSTSSESGNETFPKSVLKKHKKDSCSSSSECSKKTNEHKKNVTFNAFATVQLMEE